MEKKKYSVHSHTEFVESNDLEEARDIAMSMAQVFGSSYIIDSETDKVLEKF